MSSKISIPRRFQRWRFAIGAGAIAALSAVSWLRVPTGGQSVTVTPPTLSVEGDVEIDSAILEAVAAARQAVVDEPDSAARWGHLGMVLIAHSFDAEAAECFSVASTLDSSSQRWMYLQARSLAKLAPDKSMELLEQCLDRSSNSLDTARLVLVDKLLEQHRLEEAESHLNQCLAKHPQNVRGRIAKARLHFIRDEYAACRDLILATHRDMKLTYEAGVERAKQLATEGRNVEANSILDQTKRQFEIALSQQKTVGMLLANSLWRLGDREEASKQQELASQQSDRPWPDPYLDGIADLKTGLRAMLSKSDIAHGQQRYDEALSILRQALARYPDSVFVRIRLGRTLIRLGRLAENREVTIKHFEAAETQLDAALALSENSVEANFRQGVLAFYWATEANRIEKLPDAERFFRKAISIKPDFQMAHYNLARCLDHQKRPQEAVAAMRDAVALNPNFLPARRGLGGLLMKAGNLQEAVAELEQVVARQPNDAQARDWLNRMRQDLAQ